MWHVCPPLSEEWWEEEARSSLPSHNPTHTAPAVPPPLHFIAAVFKVLPPGSPIPSRDCLHPGSSSKRSEQRGAPESLAAIYSRPGHHDRVERCGTIHLPAAARSSTTSSADTAAPPDREGNEKRVRQPAALYFIWRQTGPDPPAVWALPLECKQYGCRM